MTDVQIIVLAFVIGISVGIAVGLIVGRKSKFNRLKNDYDKLEQILMERIDVQQRVSYAEGFNAGVKIIRDTKDQADKYEDEET